MVLVEYTLGFIRDSEALIVLIRAELELELLMIEDMVL
jgi:hypothetical protein